jgi:hypothetical protein
LKPLKGYFSPSKDQVQNYCNGMVMGYCCAKGKVDKATRGDCTKKMVGVFFANATTAKTKGRDLEMGSETKPVQPVIVVPITLECDTALGRYVVRGAHSESDAFGESDAFNVTRNFARIDFVAPERGRCTIRAEA